MMVIFVSECEKNALKKTRRVLDAFANRIGTNSWQTVITEEGLLTVKKMLRKTASKSTAVSCHWVRSRSRSEFLWVVGNKQRFSNEGVVPTNITIKKLPNDDHHDWQYFELIKALTAVAALLHDWGKSTTLFQDKLRKNTSKGDPVRHEWISLLLFHALVIGSGESDKDWLDALANGEIIPSQLKRRVNLKCIEEKPFTHLPPIAQMVAWLIVSHHRLPQELGNKDKLEKKWSHNKGSEKISMNQLLAMIDKSWSYENKRDEKDYAKRLSDCFDFSADLLASSDIWIKNLKRWGGRLASLKDNALECIEDSSSRVVLHHARLCLMLGDHEYSSKDANKQWQSKVDVYANTDSRGKAKQYLDEHLVGVCQSALKVCYQLPNIQNSLSVADKPAALKRKSPKAFEWQDKAKDAIRRWKKQCGKEKHGLFVVNMASTGKGKTMANAKIMQALSDDGESLRFVLALGLRTLTLQTGDEYRHRIGLQNDELAVLIGSKAISALHQQKHIEKTSAETHGSESMEALIDESIDFEGAIDEENLSTVLSKEKDRQFLYAPVLTCTIDHLMGAVTTSRGGRYILPALRLLSSDLVIDEIDDFVGDDLIAIGRLVHLAGMLGRKVMISSATITPDIAEGFYMAYRAGWALYTKTRHAKKQVACAWIDEFYCEIIDHIGSPGQLTENHRSFVDKRLRHLAKQPAKHKARIISCETVSAEPELTKKITYFNIIKNAALSMHADHAQLDQQAKISVSFGLVRMANINPSVELTRFLASADWPDDTEIRVMPYHSQQVLLLRHEQESHLDEILGKAGKGEARLHHPVIKKHLDNASKNSTHLKNLLFILVATPVEEVGRDHDFDWAVVEPSSYRSIIQLAGRVRRHREGEIDQPNISLLQYNWRAINNADDEKLAFIWPGYEDGKYHLPYKDLRRLLNEEDLLKKLDVSPRLRKSRSVSEGKLSSLSDLEHLQLAHWINHQSEPHRPMDLSGWLLAHWYLSALPLTLRPFRQSIPDIALYYLTDERTQICQFNEKFDDEYRPAEKIRNIQTIELTDLERKRLWLVRDYTEAVGQQAEKMNIDESQIELQFGVINLPDRENNQEFSYNDQLGFFNERNE